MPKLVYHSDLESLRAYDEGTLQVLHTCVFRGKEWYFKQPPKEITEKGDQTIRILNEAICGTVISLLCERAGHTFSTPIHCLVIGTEGSPIGLLSQRINYESLLDRGTDKKGLQRVLSMDGLAEISTIRYCLRDPDGSNNIGYGADKLSSIDYGLANFPYLADKKVLTSTEAVRLPEERGVGVFEISEQSLACFLFEPIEDVDFLSHHVFSHFSKWLSDIDQGSPELVEGFLEKTYKTLHLVAEVLTADGFKETIFDRLGLDELGYEEDRRQAQSILDVLIKNAIQIKQKRRSLSDYSPDDLEQLVTNDFNGRLSPKIARAMSGSFSEAHSPMEWLATENNLFKSPSSALTGTFSPCSERRENEGSYSEGKTDDESLRSPRSSHKGSRDARSDFFKIRAAGSSDSIEDELVTDDSLSLPP